MADAARLLPILGGILFVIPLLWLPGADGGTGGPASTRTAAVIVYVFVVWAALTGIAGLLSRRLGPEDDQPSDQPSHPPGDRSSNSPANRSPGEDGG